MNDSLQIANKTFNSRLFLGTGKYSNPEIMQQTLLSSETELVTMALRRVNLNNPQDSLLNHLNPEKYSFLPNTAGAKIAEEAIRMARMSKASGYTNWIKLEVVPDAKALLPDAAETYQAAKILISEGFIVLPYIQADPVLAKKLEDIGCVTVMPLAAPIGSNKGLQTKEMLKIIIKNANIPVVVDAGIGSPSQACEAMEMGAAAVLVNTAIAVANNPIEMAKAFSLAVKAGRQAYLAGLGATTEGEASSPIEWLFS